MWGEGSKGRGHVLSSAHNYYRNVSTKYIKFTKSYCNVTVTLLCLCKNRIILLNTRIYLNAFEYFQDAFHRFFTIILSYERMHFLADLRT